MKKCSTAAPWLAAGPASAIMLSLRLSSLLCLPLAAAHPPALAAMESAGCPLADDAPEVHRVTPGDTLWGLASRFLRDPWCWPELWAQNRAIVVNPHRIYPGQQIRLDRTRGLLVEDTGEASDLPVQRLSPSVRGGAIAAEAVALIDASLMKRLQRTPLITMDELASTARIVGIGGDHQMGTSGDLVYARRQRSTGGIGIGIVTGTGIGTAAGARAQQVGLLRPLAPVIDPESGRLIAMVTRRIGQAGWLRDEADGLQVMRITEASEEVLPGDVLAALPRPGPMPAIVPHAALLQQGRVAAVLHEGRWASQHDTVVLNRGTQHGLDPGSVVQVGRPVRILPHDLFPTVPRTDEPVATLLVISVLEQAALAIVMQSREPFTAGAPVAAPAGPKRAGTR